MEKGGISARRQVGIVGQGLHVLGRCSSILASGEGPCKHYHQHASLIDGLGIAGIIGKSVSDLHTSALAGGPCVRALRIITEGFGMI
jgi:hypothetical protein